MWVVMGVGVCEGGEGGGGIGDGGGGLEREREECLLRPGPQREAWFLNHSARPECVVLIVVVGCLNVLRWGSVVAEYQML